MKNLIPTLLLSTGLLSAGAALYTAQAKPVPSLPPDSDLREPGAAQIVSAFASQGIRINGAEAQGIRPNIRLALREARVHGLGNSKVDFAAAEIAGDLGMAPDTVKQIVAAIGTLMGSPRIQRPHPLPPPMEWNTYFHETTQLWHQPSFMALMAKKQFHPVKISWEDIGRDENSSWGDRISDVGIWVRKDERDSASARLALSVRRDSNFRDKVLMVPADRIKIHTREYGRTVEKTLPQRLKELGLASQHRDRNVIVSNQFAIVPVPSRAMHGAWPEGVPPRAAFNFSIYPYGSTNFVITDVIEGSHEAIVGPGQHQMLYANIGGQKAPFTASRAEDRPDLLKLEKTLKAQGMDVDVQRYYLIQIPLKRDGRIRTSQMGTPPAERGWGYSDGVVFEESVPPGYQSAPMGAGAPVMKSQSADLEGKKEAAPGLGKVAIGHGEVEGSYFTGSGYQGTRAEEPIRVTVVYFVTPIGKITAKDMEAFSQAFAQWDAQAIWGGSFVTKETN